MRGALHAGNLAASRDASIWSVAKDGANLTVCFDSVLERLPEGMQWFRRISDRREVLRILIEDDEDLMSLWGFGNKPSPTRSYLTGYVARALGNTALAKRELDAAVTSKCFDGLFATVDEALRRT
jgi:hypothetical protein